MYVSRLCVCTVPHRSQRGCQVAWRWGYRWLLAAVWDRKQTQVLCKSSHPLQTPPIFKLIFSSVVLLYVTVDLTW